MRHPPPPPTRSLATLTAVLAALACGDATGVDPDELAGTWRATTAIATNPADSSQSDDILALGLSVTFIIEASGRIETRFELQDIVSSDTGTLTVTDGEFAIFIDGQRSTGTISRRDDTLTMDIITGVEWDFGPDGLDEPATLFLVMRRDAQSSNP